MKVRKPLKNKHPASPGFLPSQDGFVRTVPRAARTGAVRRGQVTHGHTRGGVMSPTYRSWLCMRDRCRSPSNLTYKNYGGRGIRVCGRWDRFENFLEDMGERPEGTSIDRIDSNGNYEPGNCRWLRRDINSAKQRTNKLITFRGKTQSISAWAFEIASKTGITRKCISDRLIRGWPVDVALTKRPAKRLQR